MDLSINANLLDDDDDILNVNPNNINNPRNLINHTNNNTNSNTNNNHYSNKSSRAIRWKRGEILGQGAFGVVYLGLNIEYYILIPLI